MWMSLRSFAPSFPSRVQSRMPCCHAMHNVHSVRSTRIRTFICGDSMMLAEHHLAAGQVMLFADVVFGYLWAKVLHKLQSHIDRLELGECFPFADGPNWYAPPCDEPTSAKAEPFLGPCWCDDLCICMSSDSLETLAKKAALISGFPPGLVQDAWHDAKS